MAETNFKTGADFIPPDYAPSEDDDEVEDLDESIVPDEEDSLVLENDKAEEQIEESRKQTQINFQKPNMSTPPFGTPFGGGNTTGFGTSQSWGGSGTPASNPWESASSGPSSSGFNSKPFGNNAWSSGASGTQQREIINREKEIIFIDFLDCIVETYQSNKMPGLKPRDIYDLKPRFDVWAKLAAFGQINRVYMITPINQLPSTNGIEGWNMTLSYFCCCLSSFLNLPYRNCQILAQTMVGQPKEDVMLALIDNDMYPMDRSKIVSIGLYSGQNGQSNVDIIAAQRCGVDHLDLNQFLNNMY